MAEQPPLPARILAESFPRVPRIRGVYFLLKGDAVVYVGQSCNILSRLTEHADKDYDRWTYVEVPDGRSWQVESEWIERLKPKYNHSLRGTRKRDAEECIRGLDGGNPGEEIRICDSCEGPFVRKVPWQRFCRPTCTRLQHESRQAIRELPDAQARPAYSTGPSRLNDRSWLFDLDREELEQHAAGSGMAVDEFLQWVRDTDAAMEAMEHRRPG